MSETVTKDDLRDFRDEVREGIKGMHARQDKTNGRIGALEVQNGRFDERLEAVERDNEAFHLHRRATDPPPAPKPTKDGESGDDRRLTQRDVSVFVLGAGGAIGLFKLLPWLVSLAQVKP